VTTQSGTSAARRRKMFSLADEIGLDDDEQIELCRAILWRDITSRSQLTDAQVSRMLDAYEGWEKIDWLLRNRAAPPPPRDTASAPAPGRS
jgi:hypothetical protein